MNLRQKIDETYLFYLIAFDLYFLVTEQPNTPTFVAALANLTYDEIRKYGYERTLVKHLGKYEQ